MKGNEMESDSILAFAVLFVLLVLSIFFSANETAYSALNKIRLKHMAEKGSKRAAMALKMHKDFNKLLSTLLVGNNVVNLSMASICAVLFVRRFGDIGATISTVVLTVVVVVFADVTPKVLAKESPEKVVQICAPFLRFIMFLLAPVNWFFKQWKRLLNLVFKSNAADKAITEAELISIVEEAEQDGTIDPEDSKLLHNALEFYDQHAKDILTPRIDVTAIPLTATTEEISAKFLGKGLSRLPVYDETIDNIVGILHMRDFLGSIIQRTESPLIESLMTPPIFVAPLTNISDLFKQLQKEKSHIAVVSDEYGGTEGIVTMEDILEELVGEIWDESDEVVEKIQPTGSGSNTFKVLGLTPMDDFFEFFNMPAKKSATEAPTVSGWIVDMLEKIPEAGDSFTVENLTVTVHKTQHRRALECIVTENMEELSNV